MTGVTREGDRGFVASRRRLDGRVFDVEDEGSVELAAFKLSSGVQRCRFVLVFATTSIDLISV